MVQTTTSPEFLASRATKGVIGNNGMFSDNAGANPLIPLRRVARHKFAPDINERIKALYDLDNWHSPLALGRIYAVISICMLVPGTLAKVIGWWPAYVVSVVVIGCEMRALATVLHESVHRIAARSAWLNYALGTFFSGYLIMQSWTAYFVTHVIYHHPHLGDEHRDPDYKFHLDQGVYRPTSPLRFALINFVAPLFLVKTPAKIIDLIQNRLLSRHEPRRERWARIVYSVALAALTCWLGYGRELVAFWLVPLVTVFPVVNWYNEFFEHYPFVATGTTDIEMSRNRWPGPIALFLTCQLNENFHQLHHLKHRVPFWNLPAAHEILMEDPTYRMLQVRELGLVLPSVAGIPSVVLNIVRLASRRNHG